MKNRHCVETLPILLAVASSSLFGHRPASEQLRLAGLTDITESVKDLTDVIKGINAFLSGVSFISETIGFGTILLFLAVIVFSAGYSALGMARGKITFFSSLLTADALWVFWKASLNEPLSENLYSIIRSNLIVLCPPVIAVLLSRAAPGLLGKTGRIISSLFSGKKQLGQREAAALCDECQARSAMLNRALLEDILAAPVSGGPVNLSPETRRSAEALRETLDKINTTAK